MNEKEIKSVGADLVSAHTLKTRRNNGITLIALIITIIIMLILVGVTITVAVNGGLFEYAGRAGKETNEAIEKEQQLASGDIIEYYLNRKDAVVALKPYSTELLDEATGVLTENTKYEDGYNMAVIPKGFKVSDVSSEQTIANGLVIEDEDRNQFVWIPVKDGTFERTGWWENEPTTQTLEEITKDFDDEDYMLYVAKSYGYNSAEEAALGEGFADENGNGDTDAWLADNFGTWKEFFNDCYYWAGALSNEYTENNDPTGEYANMIASVAKYGGFYIGRYEAGSNNNRSTTRTDETVLVQKGAYPYNYVCWAKNMTDYEETYTSGSNNYGHGAVYLSKNMYTEESTYGVTSTLCYGVQWDAALRFIKDKVDVTNSTVWGNYGNHRFTFSGKYSSNNGSTWSDEVTNETKPGGNG
ncbi:MAG: hypothetical protein ACI4VP_01660, partial [Clostridia bacterium]